MTYQTLELNISAPLFSESSLATLVALEELVRASDSTPVLLLQRGELTDTSPAWQNELKELFLCTLQARLLRFRLLLQRITASRRRFIYLSFGTCYGSAFELALACHAQGFFGDGICVGFPLLPIGLPVSASLDETAPFWETWLKKSVLRVEEAQEQRLISCAASGKDLETLSAVWLKSLSLMPPPRSGIKLAAAVKPSFKGLVEIEKEWLKSLKRGPFATPVEALKQLLRSKKTFKHKEDQEGIFTLIAARSYLANSDPAYFSALPKAERKVQEVLSIRIGSPLPLSFFEAALDRNLSLVFFHPDVKILTQGLEKAAMQLSELAKGMSFWQKRISWMLQDQPIAGSACLELLDGYRVLVTADEASATFYALNHFDQRPMLEGPLFLKHQAKLQRLLSLLGSAVFHPSLNSGLPLSYWCRFALLSELLRIAKATATDLSRIFSILKQKGWQFAAQEAGWESFFVQKRHATEGCPREFAYLARASLHGLSSLKQAIAYSSKATENEPIFVADLGEHLQLFSAHLLESLNLATYFGSFAEAAGFLAATFGAPRPPIRQAGYGKERYQLYRQTQWTVANLQ